MSNYKKARPFDHHHYIINFNYAQTYLYDVAFEIPVQIRENILICINF